MTAPTADSHGGVERPHDLRDTPLNVAQDSGQDRALIANGIAQLQKLAAAFSQPLPATRSVLTLQVVFVSGTTNAWRLIEIVRSGIGRRKRMLCFDSFEEIRRSMAERLAWQRADAQFVADHMSTSGGFPGVTADWAHSKDFESIFLPSRDAIRKEICATSPKRTVPLP
jgi:hypothetical protein